MKKLVLALMAVSIAFYACKKDDKGNTVVTAKPISPDSAQLLSDSLQVLNVTATTKGALPAAAGTDLTIDTDHNLDTVYAVSGGYAMIVPFVNGGTPKGYYVSVKGANTYFTLDFPVTQAPLRQASKHAVGLLGRMQDAADSVIALKLPLNMLPGTFTVQYEAYDANKQVSATATRFVKVLTNDQASADFKTLAGNWHTSLTFSEDGKGDSLNIRKYGADSTVEKYSCDGTLYQDDEYGDPIVVERSKQTELISFTGGNRFLVADTVTSQSLDFDKSSCGSLVYTTNQPETNVLYAGFSYTSSSKQLLLITDGNGHPNGAYGSVQAYTVTTLTANKLEIVQYGEGTYHIVFTK